MEIKNNKLILGEIAAEQLVKEYGSPLYVYEEDRIRERFNDLNTKITYPKKKLYYACKANTNPQIMKLLESLGSCIDAVSPGEVHVALKAGFSAERILFTGNNANDADMKFCIDHKVMVNCGSLAQIERYGKLDPGAKISVRINPDIGAGHHGHAITGGPHSKFGIYYDKVAEIKEAAAKSNLKIIGIHSHIGSGILDTEKFKEAMQMVMKTAKEFEGLKFVDFGGGIGIPYRPDEQPIDIDRFGKEISEDFSKFCKEYGTELTLALEPGRYIVAESGWLLITTNNRKSTPKHTFIGTDSGFNHLIRPTMYGSYHEIINASNVEGDKEKVVIAGNICESGDTFTRTEKGVADREMTKIEDGNVLAIANAGAYGFSMSSNYNTRPRPAEVLVRNGKSRMIRRRETFDDLMQTADV